jgi:hypothetical protein
MQTLYARDLSDLPEAANLWRPRQASASRAVDADVPLLLPRDGFASPIGFWFAPAESWTEGAASLRVEVVKIDEFDRGGDQAGSGVRPAMDGLEKQYAHIELRAGRGHKVDVPSFAPSTLSLEIDACSARICVASAAWPSVAPAVLVTVAQFWRLLAIERKLGDLTDWAHGELQQTRSVRAFLSRWRRLGEVRTRRQDLQSLILDLPVFEGPLTDPRGYLPTGRSLRIYRSLSARLGLARRRRLIDERVECVEAVFDSLAESADHFQALFVQLVLELMIVAALIVDIVLHFLE